MGLRREKKVAASAVNTPKLNLSMRVIRRDKDGNVLGVEDHGVISSNFKTDVEGNIVDTSHGKELRFPRMPLWGTMFLLALTVLFAVFMGQLHDVIPAAVVLTNAGEEWLVDKIGETVQTQPNFVDWGTGAGTAAKTDTTVFTVAPEARVSATYSKVGTGSAAVAQYVATLTSAAGATITNVGFWTAVSGGTLVIHADHAATVLNANDQIQYTLTVDPS